MRRHVVLIALLALAACGDDPPAPPAPVPPGAIWVAQEVWLTYHDPEHMDKGRRIPRPKEEAKALAASLREQVLAGDDIGAIARAWSNAPGGAADGFSGWMPVDRTRLSTREEALRATPVGGVTPLVDFNGGWWFGRRVTVEEGRALAARFDRIRETRVRLRAIAIHYVGAWPYRYEVTATKEQAVAAAQALLQRIQAGEDFAALARAHSNDGPSADRGGLVVRPTEEGGTTEWIDPWWPGVPASVFAAALETPVGEVYPDVIVSERGVFLLKVEGRRP